MSDSNPLQSRAGLSNSAGDVSQDPLRGMLRQMIANVVTTKVTEPHGSMHRLTSSEGFQADPCTCGCQIADLFDNEIAIGSVVAFDSCREGCFGV